ncbi:MAG TPA: hypothetical protein VIJ51_05775 [Solirubrobacteraceae bacterium]
MATTPGVEDLAGRAGEGVGIPGWDLRASLARPSPWLPAGALAFELGVGRSSLAKAQKEYLKRSADPLDVVPRETTFVFATPRRWRGGAAWASERRADGIWRDVRVLDGDTFEAWLEETPAVQYWISEQIGLRPGGVQTAEEWWGQFSHRTRPALPPALFLAGRGSARTEMFERLTGPEASLGVRAAWREDALAFICASLGADQSNAAPARPALIVHSREAWTRISAEPGGAILIPLFPDPDVAAAIGGGRHVVLPFGRDAVRTGAVLELSPPDRLGAQEAMREAGFEFDAATRLAALSRRSMPALVRRLAVNPHFARPFWSESPLSGLVAPLLLAGSWTDAEGDQAAITRLTDRPWLEIERALREAARASDPPVVLSGSVWRMASPDEAYEVLSSTLTASDLRRWSKLVIDVLLWRDPVDELPEPERVVATMRRSDHPVSRTLRQGLAEALALLASHSSDRVGGATCEDWALSIARQILDAADADDSGATWRSLSAELPLIAEAAPELFLDRVLVGSSGPAPMLSTMFGDRGPAPVFGGSSPHTGLLWALEALCWSDAHLLGATRALAQLDALDPGGRLSNRPSASMTSVLVPWIRHTNAPLEVRIGAVNQVVRDLPDVGWKLIAGLWPSNHATVIPPHSPRYRDWKPDGQGVPIPEWLAFIDYLVNTAIAAAGDEASRWAELVGRLASLPPQHRDRIIDGLNGAAGDLASDPTGRLVLWEALSAEVEHHRSFPDAQWSMPDAVLDTLEQLAGDIEPSDNVQRHARLFDWHVNVGIKRSDNFEEHEAALLKLRTAAVDDTLAAASIDGVGRLADRAPVPMHLGVTVARVSGDAHRDTLLAWLGEDGKRREVAAAWARSRSYEAGVAWVAAALRDLHDDDLRVIVALNAPATSELWAVLEQTSKSLLDRYWAEIAPMSFGPGDSAPAAIELLAHGRPSAAVTATALELHRPSEQRGTVDRNLVLQILEDAITNPSPVEYRGDSVGYEIGVLLDYLDSLGTDRNVLARFEFAFFSVLEYQRLPRALYGALGESPDLFVDLVSGVYRAKHDSRQIPGEQAAALAHHAWRVLGEWRTVPGLRDDGTLDEEHLRHWVDRARLLLSDCGRSDVGDEQIGQLLSGSPLGNDGGWPAEPIRELVERLGSRDIENGIHIGKMNARGVISRGIYDGGAQERELAARFRGWAATTAGRWPRTTRLLRELERSYERDAAREDMRALEDADDG